MVGVNGGRFRMGCVSGIACRANEPVREVELQAFAMSVYEVTRGDFRRFVEQTGYVTDGERAPNRYGAWDALLRGVDHACMGLKWDAPLDYGSKWNYGYTWMKPGYSQTDEHPAVCISWADTQAYLQWLAAETDRPYRLPSEAEWEYAARAGAGGAALDEETASRILFCDELYRRKKVPSREEFEACNVRYWNTQAVGQREPNAFGLQGMLDNATEWVEDCWQRNYRGAPLDGTAWTEGRCRARVLRVGDNSRLGAPAEIRGPSRQQYSRTLQGFRVVLPTSD